MMAWVEGRYAARSVGRNLRRTALSVLGIGVGCALALLMESMNRGRDELFARAAAYSGAGHLRVVPGGWRSRRDPRLRLADGAAALAAARDLPDATAVTARSRAQVLLAMGSRVLPLEMVGVDPENEPRTFRFVRRVSEGRYLEPGDRGAIVVGKGAADRLEAELGDEVLATAVGKGGRIEAAMFRIVGIVATGSEDIDASIGQVTLADVEDLTGLRGPGEVTVILADYREAEAGRARLATRVGGGDEALTWGEISPEFAGHLEQDAATNRLVRGIILLIALLGVASAQLAAVLERRREFAVLSALGMGAGRMVRLVLQEALALGLAGAAAGLALALPLLWLFERRGLDFRRFMGTSYAFQGVIIEPVIYGDLGAWVFPWALGIALGATAFASLFPAWFAARTDPAAALRVAQ
jgi:ABC-type lipoprotein release transport system permease subunit